MIKKYEVKKYQSTFEITNSKPEKKQNIDLESNSFQISLLK